MEVMSTALSRALPLTLLAAAAVFAAPPSHARTRRRRPRRGTTLKVGDAAPDFELDELDEGGGRKGRTNLSGFRGKSPVVLVFSSYT